MKRHASGCFKLAETPKSTEDKNEEKQPRNITPEELRLRRIKQICILAEKLKNTSPSFREGAYWEQLEEDCQELISRPLG
jgi:hypothetical protein